MAIKSQTINQIFNDLDTYRNFCSTYGYKFNEAELYNQRSNTYRLFQKFQTGRKVRNQWEIDFQAWKDEEITKGRR